MNFYKKLLIVFFVLGATTISCDLDKQVEGPYQLSPDQANLEALYNNIQLAFSYIYEDVEMEPGTMTRMYHSFGWTYRAATTPETFNGLWGNVYNNMLPDIAALEEIDNNKGNILDIHIGSAKIMEAYTLMSLVDLFGNVPFSEALQGINVISPKLDDGADVYAEAITLLDDAIARLSGTAAAKPGFDNFYGGDPDKWITAAKTLKMKAALNTGDAAMFNSILTGGDFIDDPSEDFQFNYSSNRNNPDSRNWKYANHYETGDGVYMSNYFMWALRSEKNVIDPRTRYYFYRKVDDAAGGDATEYSCHFSVGYDPATIPAYYTAVDPNMPYCIAADDGYWGRDHLNDEGIPPDGPTRTSWGLYPAGGDFDADDFTDSRKQGTTGGKGAGIAPIMLSSYVYFMRAEAALTMGTGEDARQMMMDGINASLDKVESFESLVSEKMAEERDIRGTLIIVKDFYGMSSTTKAAYTTEVGNLYDAATTDQERLAVTSKEFFIAAFGNGLESYNMYRRTGYPDNLQPALESAPGPFPLSFFYPSNSVNRNANVDQKTDLTTSVFWQDASIIPMLY